jgi:hypothetical protein
MASHARRQLSKNNSALLKIASNAGGIAHGIALDRQRKKDKQQAAALSC